MAIKFILACSRGVTVIVTIICLIVIGIATFRTDWQSTKLSDRRHYNGLFEYCFVNLDGYTNWQCYYRSDEPSAGSATRQNRELVHTWTEWVRTTLGLMVMSLIFGVISVCVSVCTAFKKQFGIAWAIFTFLSALLGCAGVTVFGANARQRQNREVIQAGEMREVNMGHGFWLAVAGAGSLWLPTFMAVFCVLGAYLQHRIEPHDWPRMNQIPLPVRRNGDIAQHLPGKE